MSSVETPLAIVQHHGVHAVSDVQDSLMSEASAMILGDLMAARFSALYRTTTRKAKREAPKIAGRRLIPNCCLALMPPHSEAFRFNTEDMFVGRIVTDREHLRYPYFIATRLLSRHLAHPLKISGTFGHLDPNPSGSNQTLVHTINAFQHYVLEGTRHTHLIVDIQGDINHSSTRFDLTSAHLGYWIKDNDGQPLFCIIDPECHS